MSVHVFISYAAEDLVHAEVLAMELVSAGANVWFDRWRIQAGDRILGSIDTAIEDCNVFIVLLSRHAEESPWVTQETAVAFHRMLDSLLPPLRMVPIRLDDSPIPLRYRDLHVIDFSQEPSELLERLLPVIAPNVQLHPDSSIHIHTREQFFDKAISVLRLQPRIVRTTMVGPIFLNSRRMVEVKQSADHEQRASLSLAFRSFLQRQLTHPISQVYIIIKLNLRYSQILANLALAIDLRHEFARMRDELAVFLPSSSMSRLQFAVSHDIQFAFMVTDNILIEADRYSMADKMHEGYSTTQPGVIKQKIRMFDAAFQRVFTDNPDARHSLTRFLDDTERSLYTKTTAQHTPFT